MKCLFQCNSLSCECLVLRSDAEMLQHAHSDHIFTVNTPFCDFLRWWSTQCHPDFCRFFQRSLAIDIGEVSNLSFCHWDLVRVDCARQAFAALHPVFGRNCFDSGIALWKKLWFVLAQAASKRTKVRQGSGATPLSGLGVRFYENRQSCLHRFGWLYPTYW